MSVYPKPLELKGDATKRRLFAAWIDGLLAMMTGGFAALLFIQVPSDPSGRWLIFSLGYLGYFFVQEWIWSATLGKLLFGLRIVHLDGRPAGLGAAAWRTLLRLYEVNPFLLGYLPGGLVVVRSKRRQRVGDMIAETVVVRRSALTPATGQTPNPSKAGSGGLLGAL